MKAKKIILSLNILLLAATAQAQVAMGGWRTHFSYNEVSQVEQTPDKVFAVSDGSLFSVEKQTDWVETYSKITALNGSQVAQIRYNEAQNALFVAYADGNIDVMYADGTRNIPDVKNKVVSVDKFPNDVSFRDEFAYIANGIGVVVVNLKKKEIADTYVVGHNNKYVTLRTVKFAGDSIYAVSSDSIYAALASDRFLGNFERWTSRKPRPEDAAIVATDSHTSVFDAKANLRWTAAGTAGLLKTLPDGTEINRYKPDGPASNQAKLLNFVDGRLIAVKTAIRIEGNGEASGAVMIFENEKWHNIIEQQISPNFRGLSAIAIDPNDATHYYVSSWSHGFFEFRNDALANYWFDTYNPASAARMYTGLTFDKNRHLWRVEDNYPTLTVILNSGRWITLSYPFKTDGTNNYWFGDLYTGSNNFKWFKLSHVSNNPGVFVLDDRNNPEARSTHRTRLFNSAIDQKDNIINFSYVRSLVEDKEKNIWVGCTKGIVVFRDVENVFNSNYRVHRPLIPRQNDVNNLADYLLENQPVYSIAIDGANRKWIGTESAGVLLVSADGLETIHHFTAENSPLLADKVYSIAINNATGEVFFATEAGLISYQGDAADGEKEFSKATFSVYPNPVRENFTGRITMEGFMNNSTVEITNAAGNLVYKTKSNGRLATWDGKNAAGQAVSAGVYFVIGVSEDGKKSGITKLLIIR